MNRATFLSFVFALICANCLANEKEPAFSTDIGPLLKSHCVKCHGGDAKEAEVDLAKFVDEAAALRSKKLLRRVLAQIESGDMPPVDEPELQPTDRAMLVTWTKSALARPVQIDDAARDPGPAIIRRLTRTEYNNTIRDLLGVEYDVAGAVGMPDESVSQGFDNLAEALKLQAVLLEKYFAAADKALERFSTPITNPANASDQQAEQRRQAAYDRILYIKPGEGLSKRQAARQIMQRFLLQAYRRPPEGLEVERYLKVFEVAGAGQQPFEQGVLAMLKAALVSPNFLLRIEENRAPEGSRDAYRISEYELASRLSYFLWSSMPDDRLFTLASEGKLSDRTVLNEEVRRMLADPKARALTDNFAGQWLQLRRLPSARPSSEFFPTLTPQLRQSMYEETALLFDSIRQEDRSLLSLLNANYTFVNGPLAEHYGIAGVTGAKFQRVELKADDVRGGLLGMASILTLNSHTFRTSPTMRGKWILEVVFGTPPPPPPANVSQLKEETEEGQEPKDFRETLAQHAKDATCASCHKRIDPLGFGLENFDAIGRYRQTHGGAPIDATGVLPGGEKFSGVRELKKIVLRRQDDFVRNIAAQMTSYALGRELGYDDEVFVENLMLELAEQDYKLSVLVNGIVHSFAFDHRRNLTDK